MPRALFLCPTIVAAFQAPLSGAPSISDLAPVDAPLVSVARSLGLDPDRDPARFVAEFARLLHTPPEDRSPGLAAVRAIGRAGRPAGSVAGLLVPVPLSADVWSAAVFRRPVPLDELVLAIMTDRRAALLAYALAALDDETLTYLVEQPSILARFYQNAAPAFGAFGWSLRIAGNRVVPAGGPEATPLWESVVGERVDQPDRFIRALFELHAGRLAYLYSAIAQLDLTHQRFALGSWMQDAAARQQRFAVLAAATVRAHGGWRLETVPMSRPMHDVALLLQRVRVSAAGAPAPPASTLFWTAALESDDPHATSVRPPGDAPAIDAGFLVERMMLDDTYARGDRLDQLAFGQRVLGGADPDAWGDALASIRAFRRYRMLLLALERMGARAPSTYALAARTASRLPTRDATRTFWTLAQFQGALALVARASTVGTIAPTAAEELVRSLCAVAPGEGGQYLGGVARWFTTELLPRLPSGFSADERILLAVSGLAGKETARTVHWEGEQYRLSFASAELQRLHAVRAKQMGPAIDVALALNRVVVRLAAAAPTAGTAAAAAASLAGLADGYGEELQRSIRDVLAPGVVVPRPAGEQIERAIAELDRVGSGQDVARRIERLTQQLAGLVDALTGEALLTLAYAADLGDPDGAALLTRNVALRHDFGLTRVSSELRIRTPWAQPRQDFLPGVPWHVTGSLLGLDLALAPLSLHRMSPDRMTGVPQLPSNEREGFAVSVALMNPHRLTNEDRDAIAGGIARGWRRIARLADRPDDLAEVETALALDGWRRRAIRWRLTHDRARVAEMFALAEVLALGNARVANLDAWGTAALLVSGCPCTEFVPPTRWRLLNGRPQLGLMSSAFAELNLHVAVSLAAMDLPAALARAVLAAAVQEFIEVVDPTDANDWWTLVAAARAVPRERIEDYVAAATAVGGPLVPDNARAAVEP